MMNTAKATEIVDNLEIGTPVKFAKDYFNSDSSEQEEIVGILQQIHDRVTEVQIHDDNKSWTTKTSKFYEFFLKKLPKNVEERRDENRREVLIQHFEKGKISLL